MSLKHIPIFRNISIYSFFAHCKYYIYPCRVIYLIDIILLYFDSLKKNVNDLFIMSDPSDTIISTINRIMRQPRTAAIIIYVYIRVGCMYSGNV